MPQNWLWTQVVGGWMCQKSGFYYEKQGFCMTFLKGGPLRPRNETSAKSWVFMYIFGRSIAYFAILCPGYRKWKKLIFHRFFLINFSRSSIPYVFKLLLLIIMRNIWLMSERSDFKEGFNNFSLLSLIISWSFHMKIDEREKLRTL